MQKRLSHGHLRGRGKHLLKEVGVYGVGRMREIPYLVPQDEEGLLESEGTGPCPSWSWHIMGTLGCEGGPCLFPLARVEKEERGPCLSLSRQLRPQVSILPRPGHDHLVSVSPPTFFLAVLF